MHVRCIAPFLFATSTSVATFACVLAALPTPARAQSANVLSNRVEADAAYARKLYELGQTDMAEALCDLLEKSGKLSGQAETTVKALHIDLRLEIARKTSDLAQRKDLLKTALLEKEDFIKQHPGTPESQQAGFDLPDVYAQLGDTLKLMIKAETQPTVIADYQAEGQKVYQEAEERLKTRIEELQKIKDERDEKGEDEDEKLLNQLMAARFNLPRTMYGHAQLYNKEEFRRKDLLDQAIKLLQEFGLDFPRVVFTYEATIIEGLCLREEGQNDDALAVWTDVAKSLSEGWEVNPKTGMIDIDPVVSGLVSKALLQKALLLTELKRAQEGIPDIKEYFAKMNGAYDTPAGLALLYQLGEMQIAAGDTDGATKTAEKLIQIDGNGPWGANGLALQNKLVGSGGADLGSDKLLALASTQFNRRNEARALELCRQAASNAKGSADDAENGLKAYLLMGDIFRSRDWNYEAALCYDAGADRYPNLENAPEAVYRALQAYSKINETEKRLYFKNKIGDHMKLLTTKYPTHPRASYALVVEGQGYEADGEFLKAAKTYEKVTPDARSYLIAQFSAANAYFLYARSIAKDPAKKAEAKPHFDSAIAMLLKLIPILDAAAEKTFDIQEQQLYVSTSFKARLVLAQIYNDDDVARYDDTLKTLEGLDTDRRFSGNPENVGYVWSLRIQAYKGQGKLEEAAKVLDGLLASTPDSPAIASAAGAVAREYDRHASESKDPRVAEDSWKKAAKYYRISGQAQLRTAGGRLSDATSVAERLYVLGLILNKVPGDTFLGWRGAKTANLEYWSLSADLYEAALKQSPSRKGQLYLARACGFLGQWTKAANAFAAYFEGIALVDPGSGRFDNEVLKEYPGIDNAYVEYGVCESRAGKAENNSERYARALKIFGDISKNPAIVPPDSKEWWFFKYDQIQALISKGDYGEAGRVYRDAERTTPVMGKPAGLEDEFKLLKAEISKNTFEKNGIQTPTGSR